MLSITDLKKKRQEADIISSYQSVTTIEIYT